MKELERKKEKLQKLQKEKDEDQRCLDEAKKQLAEHLFYDFLIFLLFWSNLM